MTSDRTRDLILPLAILVSVAVGVGIGATLSRSVAAATPTVSPSPMDTRELVETLQPVRAELARLRETSADDLARAPGTTRAQATGPTDATSDLRATWDPGPDATSAR